MYETIFLATMSETKEELQILGKEKSNLGNHSYHKGVVKIVATDCTTYHPIISICIREVCLMRGVKDRHLNREYTGNKYVSRCTSGLSQLKKLFVISPPHFDFTSHESELNQIFSV